MKKLFLIAALVMGVLVVNAQRTPVKVADLQKSITDNIAKDYAGFTIKEATKVVENNVVSYDVMIVKGTTHETLLFDKDGKFIKKMAMTAGTTEKKNPKTATSTPKKK